MYTPQEYAAAMNGGAQAAPGAPHGDVLASFLQMLGPLLHQQAATARAGQQLQTDQTFGRHLGMYGGAVDPATGMDSTSPWSNGTFASDHGHAAAVQKENNVFGASQTGGQAHAIFPEGVGTVTGIDHPAPEFVGPNPMWLTMPGAPTEYMHSRTGGMGDPNFGQMTGAFTPGRITDARGRSMMSTAPAFRGPRLRY